MFCAPWLAEGTVEMVRRGVIPAAETLRRGTGEGTRRVMLVEQG